MSYLEIENAVSQLKVKESKVALMTLSFYVDGAIAQWDRINFDEQKANDENALSSVYETQGNKAEREKHKRFSRMAKHQEIVDLHLYSIGADKIAELMREVIKNEESKEIEKFWNGWRKEMFDTIHKLRVIFENPHMYLQKGWDTAYFGVFLHESRISVGRSNFDLKVIGIDNVKKFFKELLSHLQTVNTEDPVEA